MGFNAYLRQETSPTAKTARRDFYVMTIVRVDVSPIIIFFVKKEIMTTTPKPYERIVLNIPHASVEGIAESSWQLTPAFLDEVRRWTDWYTDWLFIPTEPSLQQLVLPVRFPLSRFIVDAERLYNDPMESKGQGILYTDFNGHHRCISEAERTKLMQAYEHHQHNLQDSLVTKSLLIDCHSFPSPLSDIDVCIGFNDDWSRPSQSVFDLVYNHFASAGYKVAFNTPYSNSITPPMDIPYPSLMLELNKRIYMDETTLRLSSKAENVRLLIQELYNNLLKF